MREWVFFGLVACPNVLKGDLAMKLLKLVVSDGWRMLQHARVPRQVRGHARDLGGALQVPEGAAEEAEDGGLIINN